MQLKTILNRVQKFKSFVYGQARWEQQGDSDFSLIIEVEARANSRPVCAGCEKPSPGYDMLTVRRFEFIPIWNIAVFFEYALRRVDCRRCGVRAEKLPWASGKSTLTRSYMQFLAHWARKLSWKEVAVSFQTSWEKVCHSVEYIVEWGLKLCFAKTSYSE